MTTEDVDPLEDEPELAGLTQAGLGYIRDPYPEFARLREQSPVTRQEAAFVGGPPSYVVYSHEGVTKVLRDADTYSSTIITEGMGQVWGPKIIVGMDEPDHRHHRALVSVAFRQRTLARWEESLVGRVVDDLIDGFVEQGEADLVSEFTFAFPAKVISGVLGLPEQDYQQFQRWAVGIISIGWDWERAVQCSNELREYLEAMLAVLMGGRSAEEIFLGHITTGAGNDIERATDLARNMVCEWGMSELGPLAYGKKDEAIFLGREITQHRDYSEDTAIQIDKEVKRIVNGGYENAKRLLSTNRETLERIAQALLEREVIDANEVKMLMEGKPLPEKPRTPPPPAQAAPSTDPKVVRPELRPAPGFTRGENPAKA